MRNDWYLFGSLQAPVASCSAHRGKQVNPAEVRRTLSRRLAYLARPGATPEVIIAVVRLVAFIIAVQAQRSIAARTVLAVRATVICRGVPLCECVLFGVGKVRDLLPFLRCSHFQLGEKLA